MAQSFPAQPMRLIVPFPPGGGADVAARIVANKLSSDFGQPVVVENRTGASGNLAAQAVARAAPDGYTLLFTNNTVVANPAIGKVPFDVLRDFTPIGLVGATPIAIAVHPGLPARTMRELVDLIAAQPGTYAYSSCGAGTLMHLAGELLRHHGKLSLTHVPYRGCAPAVIDGISGNVPILISAYPNLKAPAERGQLRVLAVVSQRRSALAPAVPTVRESVPALDKVVVESWAGVLAPAGLPAPVVSRLNAALNAALVFPDVRGRLEGMGTEVQTTSSAEMREQMAAESERWKRLVQETGLVVEQ